MYCTSQAARALGDQDIRKFMGMGINHREFDKKNFERLSYTLSTFVEGKL